MRRTLAVALITAGLAVLAWLIIHPVVVERQTAAAQEHLKADVPVGSVAKADPAGVPVARPASTGDALAVMRIPRFGDDWEWAAVEGTELEQLNTGPGHYPRTPLPGARGNVAFAAHRAGHGDPFIDFDRFAPGDDVVFQQGDIRWTYVIDTEPVIVPATAIHVLDPSSQRQLTLTTCWPRYGSSKRMYVKGHLDEVTRERADGTWPEVWSKGAHRAAGASLRGSAPVRESPRG